MSECFWEALMETFSPIPDEAVLLMAGSCASLLLSCLFCILFQFNTNTLCTSISTREIVHLKINKKHLVILPIVPLHLALLTSTSTHNNNNNNQIFHTYGWLCLDFLDLRLVGCWLPRLAFPSSLPLPIAHRRLTTLYKTHSNPTAQYRTHKNEFLLFLKVLRFINQENDSQVLISGILNGWRIWHRYRHADLKTNVVDPKNYVLCFLF